MIHVASRSSEYKCAMFSGQMAYKAVVLYPGERDVGGIRASQKLRRSMLSYRSVDWAGRRTSRRCSYKICSSNEISVTSQLEQLLLAHLRSNASK